jgi:ketosteroid isomerase-like protein
MPSTKADVVRQAVDALNRADTEALLAVMTPDFEYDLTRTVSPLQGVYSRAQMPKVMAEFWEPWESVRYEPHDPAEAGDRVVIRFTTHFVGREGIDLETQATWVWTFRGAAVSRVSLYQDHAEALAAAGVAED